MYVSGEKSGVGTYVCTKCYLEIIIENDNEILPKCPDCGSGIYKKED